MAALAQMARRPPQLNLWFERLMALVALTNLLLVVFDMSYIRFRDVYLQQFPQFTQWYGEHFKGIEPERSTTAYLTTLEKLETQVALTGLQSPETEALIAELRDRSLDMIDENPFQVANKSGTLERIKNAMRSQVEEDSAKEAFNQFWSTEYLVANWQDSLVFLDTEIKPLIKTNYFRRIGEDGAPLDRFWIIDLGFVGLFGLEFLARTFYLSRRYRNATWFDACLWRWYDLLLLVPGWRWLRIVPVIVRLNDASLINLEPIRNRINRIFITHFAIELTEVVVLRIIDQLQNLIREGNVTRWLLDTDNGRRYIDLNGVDELQVISQRLITIVFNQVIPKVKPEIDALIHHSMAKAMDQAPLYREFKQIPGLGAIPDQLAKQVSAEVSKNLYTALATALKDPVGAELTRSLTTQFTTVLRNEAKQQEQSLREIQSLSVELLDEIKLNYVKRIAAEDVSRLKEETYRLYDVTQHKSPNL